MINPGGLAAIERILSAFVAEGEGDALREQQVIVLYYGRPPDSFESVSPIATLRNPRASAIAEIFIVMKQGNRAASASFDCDGANERAAITFGTTAATATPLGALERALLREVANTRVWYSAIRKAIDSLAVLRSWIPRAIRTAIVVVFVVGVAALIVSMFYRSHSIAEWQSEAAAALEAYEGDATELPADAEASARSQADRLAKLIEHSQASHPLLRSLLNMAIGLVCGLSLRYMSRLFPRLVFDIGEGVQRHEHLRWLRRFVLGTVVVAGVLLPIARSLWLRL